MSFIDVLRKARSSPVATLHKFRTNYDPSSRRVYAFVEGEPDRVFFQHHIHAAVGGTCDVFVYNCEGKARVFEAFRDVTSRYPDCRRVLFFVDKDLDDLVGLSPPSDPRIFVTEFYSVEAYVIGADACRAYFRDFIKIRRIEIDLERFVAEFEEQRRRFHLMMMGPMAWIIAFRRRGGEIVLKDVQLDQLFQFDGTRLRRRRRRCAHAYLEKLRNNTVAAPRWSEVAMVTRRLKSLDSRSYVRGHFDAWCFIGIVKRMSDDLQIAAKEASGSASIYMPLTETNFIQLLVGTVKCPTRLEAFLRFHLTPPKAPQSRSGGRRWWWWRSKKA